MKKLRIFAIIFILVMGIFYAGDECPPPVPPPPGPPGGGPGGSSPGKDHPDESESIGPINFKLPDGKGIGIRKIYLNGFAKENAVLMLQTSKDVEFMKEGGLDKPEVLILPTGSLYGEEENEALRLSLEEYVKIRRWGC